MNRIPSEIERALAMHQGGKVQEASDIYTDLLKRRPRDPLLLNLFGSACIQLGNVREGIRSLRKCLEIAPDFVAAQNNLGAALIDTGKSEEALFPLRRAVALEPKYPVAHYNLGRALVAIQRPRDGVVSYRQALSLQPGYIDALVSLGVVLLELSENSEARSVLAAAVERQPGNVVAQHAFARASHRLGEFETAERAYQSALALVPEAPEINNDYGLLLVDLDHDDVAERYFRSALKCDPCNAEAAANLAALLTRSKDFGESESLVQLALKLKPRSDIALDVAGLLREKQWQLAEAIDFYDQAISVNPFNLEALSHALMLNNYLPQVDQARVKHLARLYGEAVAVRAAVFRSWRAKDNPDHPIRVGFVSGDLRNHPVAYFLEAVVARLDSCSFELCFYSTVSKEDQMTDRLRGCASVWCSIDRMSDADAAQRIHDDRIDILVDLSGHTAHSRLPVFAWRPAPVQVAWLGYFSTTGVREIDYILTDRHVLPESDVQYYSERPCFLPGSYMCFSPPTDAGEVSSAPWQRNGYVTFGCFSSVTKLNSDLFSLWAKVLREIPNARLILKAVQLSETPIQQRVINCLCEVGIDVDRVHLEGPSPRLEYLARYSDVDIMLDTYPFTGGTTTAEALWMGVPVVTMGGGTWISRQGVGLLNAAGLSDWIAPDADGYVARAVVAANNLERLSELRSALRMQVMHSALCDATTFAENLGHAFRDMWRRKCDQKDPTSVSV